MYGRRTRFGLIGFGRIAENRIAREGFALDRSRFDPLEEAELAGATDIDPARRGGEWVDVESFISQAAPGNQARNRNDE